MYKIYCAGFDVFHPNAKGIAEKQKQICKNLNYEALTPMDNNYKTANDIFDNNIQLINTSDFVVANLNNFKGKDMDSGTAFEIGYAYSLNIPVFGYIDDERSIIQKNKDKNYIIVENQIYNLENFNLPINLMIAKSCEAIIQGNFTECLVSGVLPYINKNL